MEDDQRSARIGSLSGGARAMVTVNNFLINSFDLLKLTHYHFLQVKHRPLKRKCKGVSHKITECFYCQLTNTFKIWNM